MLYLLSQYPLAVTKHSSRVGQGCSQQEAGLWWLTWWNICLQCWRSRFKPWVRKILWRREWLPTPVLLPGKSHGQRSLVGLQRVRHNWATFTSLRFLGKPQKIWGLSNPSDVSLTVISIGLNWPSQGLHFSLASCFWATFWASFPNEDGGGSTHCAQGLAGYGVCHLHRSPGNAVCEFLQPIAWPFLILDYLWKCESKPEQRASVF